MNMPQSDDWRFYGYPKVTSEYSEVDSKRIGLPVYRTFPKSKQDLQAYDEERALLFARIDAQDIHLVQHAQRLGYFLCDTLTYWQGQISDWTLPLPPGYWARDMKVCDANALNALSLESFAEYKSHYSADPRIDKSITPLGYAQWASEWKGDGVVIEHETCEFPYVHRKIVAFGLFSKPCELTLAAVDKNHEGKGLYRQLVLECMRFGKKEGQTQIEISTQITNIAVQKVWRSLGLNPVRHCYTLHRWT